MKAVLTALVLVIGAAVVLWFGNTLNSWVVGGLIGGLAALLISIPISLLIFSHLSRRHDEHLRAVAQEEMMLAREESRRFQIQAERSIRMVDAQPPLLDVPRAALPGTSRRLPSQALAAADGNYPPVQEARHAADLPVPRRGTYLPEVVRQPKMPPAPTPKKRTTRRAAYPRFYGYQPGSALSRLQAEARRTARLEAAQQYDDIDLIPSPPAYVPRSYAATPQEAFDAYEEEVQDSEHLRAVRQQTDHQQAMRRANQPRPQRVVESTPPPTAASRVLTTSNEIASRRGLVSSPSDPQTEYLQDSARSASPHQSRHLPQQTGQIGRRPQLANIPADPAREPDTTGLTRHTLQRRAPYTYEDDEVRQQYARQLNGPPPVRRSSRFAPHVEEDEEV